MVGKTALIRLLALGLLLVSTFAAAPWATAADECPVTNPSCVLDTVGQTIESSNNTAQDTAEGTVQPVVDDVNERVDGVLGGGADEDPQPGEGPGGGGGSQPGDGRQHDNAGPRNGHRPGARGSAGSRAANEAPTRVAHRGVDSDTTPVEATGVTNRESSVLERIGQAGARAAKSLALVLVLAGLVVGFALIQDRVDRKDPKLALAPLDSDELRFA
jgi:hypothetical protein